MSNPFSANVPDRKSNEVAKATAPEAAAEPVSPAATAPEAAAAPVSPAATAPEAAAEPVSPAAESVAEPPALGMDEVSCRTCQYLDFKGTSRTEAMGGECRRHAPVPGADQIASWPRVTWEGWCGEWKSGVSDEDMVKMARAIADRQAEDSTEGFRETKTAPPKS